MPITDTVRAILTAAAEHSNRTVHLPDRLPAAARRAVGQSMLRAGLLEEVPAQADQPDWRTDEHGQLVSLRATQAGLEAIGSSAQAGPVAATPSTEAPSVLMAAQAVLAAWDSPDRLELAQAIETLRTALARRQTGTAVTRQPRPDTKRATVLNLLRRPEGATTAQIVEATGWAKHTVHGFLAGLKKAGTPVAVLDRVRQVGAGQGAEGSYTVYHVAEAR